MVAITNIPLIIAMVGSRLQPPHDGNITRIVEEAWTLGWVHANGEILTTIVNI
jgi:hypothetical protein